MNEPSKFQSAQEAALAAARAMGMTDFGTPDLPGQPPGPPVAATPAPAGPEGLPPSKPGDFEVPPLSPEETKALREIIYAKIQKKKDDFELPELPVTDDDRDRFGDCLAYGKAYAEEFTMMKGKFQVTFRTKTKRENDILFAQIDDDFKQGRIRSEAKYVTLLNNYNLVLQMVAFQKVPYQPAVPPGVDNIPAWSLANVAKNHVIETISEPMMYMLIGALSQFDQKVRFLSREALKENFSTPASVS